MEFHAPTPGIPQRLLVKLLVVISVNNYTLEKISSWVVVVAFSDCNGICDWYIYLRGIQMISSGNFPFATLQIN